MLAAEEPPLDTRPGRTFEEEDDEGVKEEDVVGNEGIRVDVSMLLEDADEIVDWDEGTMGGFKEEVEVAAGAAVLALLTGANERGGGSGEMLIGEAADHRGGTTSA